MPDNQEPRTIHKTISLRLNVRVEVEVEVRPGDPGDPDRVKIADVALANVQEGLDEGALWEADPAEMEHYVREILREVDGDTPDGG